MTAVIATAATLGVDLTQAARAELRIFRHLLERSAARRGLMSERAVARLDEHLLDSLSVCRFIPDAPWVRSCIDVGSGAGLPGIVAAIVRPDLAVTLLDSMRRRTQFLQEIAAALPRRHMRVVTARAEVAAHGDLRETFDIALARAVAPLSALVELTLPLLRTGGLLLAMKTARASAEIDAAGYAIEACGGHLVDRHELGWPGLRVTRVILAIEKRIPTPAHLPRRDGLPQKRPLDARGRRM